MKLSYCIQIFIYILNCFILLQVPDKILSMSVPDPDVFYIWRSGRIYSCQTWFGRLL